MSVSIRDLARNASGVVSAVISSGRPTLVTKHGKTVAAVVPIDEADLEDFVLSQMPGLGEDFAAADEAYRTGKVVTLSELVAEVDSEDDAPAV